jgi:hypothetical protein
MHVNGLYDFRQSGIGSFGIHINAPVDAVPATVVQLFHFHPQRRNQVASSPGSAFR